MAADVLCAQGEIYSIDRLYILWLKLNTAKTGVKSEFSQELQIPLGLYEIVTSSTKKCAKLFWLFLPTGCKPIFPNNT